MSAPLLDVRGLSVDFVVGSETVSAVRDVSFTLGRREVVALVGESGSGKSVTALSLVGLLPRGARVRGEALLDGEDLLAMGRSQQEAVRGTRIGVVFQDPGSALDPVFTIGSQIEEMLIVHRPGMSRAERRARVIELLEQVEIADPASRLSSYPHQLSGGQAQRVMIAIALACDPEILIADEPTTALDVTVQREVLDVLRRLRDRIGTSIVMITHDMGVVADIADRVVVMREGRVEEAAGVRELFAAPQADYTQRLLAAVPRLGAPERPVPAAETAVLDVDDLSVVYGRGARAVAAVHGVSLRVGEGEIVALAGESGSGKSTIGRCALGLAPISSGSVRIDGVDLARVRGRRAVAVKRRVGVVFQNSTAALDPRRTVGESIGEPLRVHGGLRGAGLQARTAELLDAVGLPSAWHRRYPHELSGGQRQRVAIARAISLRPRLLIADEPTSALDVSVQATVLDLLRDLQRELRFACLFISHDLAVVDELCDRIVVLQRGVVVEEGSRIEVLRRPQHPYTRALIAAAPVPDPVEQARRREAALAG
ncbi:ABC transporter ATP-binding protein [Microbacterium sp. TNHR37B]|uniref:ABC transporter ATP-binding protein n=1 Tax=Microbacterium sp. TNHR37B TaxID=1775956 RepID=UPI0007B2DBF4|nr:ABC transporter ATP-binding protein [Microbacterium sp. TNHR37B]KZE88480.1 Glutathione import ATP-binding protein GsiA [Microbacterium sp. TNHR37B]